jgi:hypothetical protein
LQLGVPFSFDPDGDSIGATGSQCPWLSHGKRGAGLGSERLTSRFASASQANRAYGLVGSNNTNLINC